jgi:hypothetical protein
VFGLTKAGVNYFAGTLADRFGRKPVLLAGWLFAVPVPLLLIWAPSWGWVIAANVLLGVNQGLAWSVTVIMKIDLVGPTPSRHRDGLQRGRRLRRGGRRRLGHRLDRRGVRPAPRPVPARPRVRRARARPVAFFVRETADHVAHEIANHEAAPATRGPDRTPGVRAGDLA